MRRFERQHTLCSCSVNLFGFDFQMVPPVFGSYFPSFSSQGRIVERLDTYRVQGLVPPPPQS